MKKTRAYLLTGMTLFSLLISCSNSKDEQEPLFPHTLTLKETKIGEFRMFVGTEEGAKEVAVEKYKPEDFWADRLELVPPTALVFEDEETMSRIPTGSGDTFSYEFRDKMLYRFNPKVEEWFWIADGDMNKLVYHIGYYRFVRRPFEGWVSSGSGQDNEWYKPEENLYEFPHSWTELTDTVVWCNMQYIFEYKK